MNWLAHVTLSPPNCEMQLGNLLADLLKGRKWPEMSENLGAGIKLHYRIDHYTDSHELWKRSCRRLSERGYLRGVVIDVVYDHFLTKHWRNFATQSMRDFLDHFYLETRQYTEGLPDDACAFVESVVESDRLGRYGDPTSVHRAMERIDERLSERIRRRETTSQYIPLLADAYDGIEADFLEFFPQLMAHASEASLQGSF